MENIRPGHFDQIQKEKHAGINAARTALITGITTLVGTGTFLYGLGVVSTVAAALEPLIPVLALLPAVAPAIAPALCLIGGIVGGVFGTICLIAVIIGIVKAINQGALRKAIDITPSDNADKAYKRAIHLAQHGGSPKEIRAELEEIVMRIGEEDRPGLIKLSVMSAETLGQLEKVMDEFLLDETSDTFFQERFMELALAPIPTIKEFWSGFRLMNALRGQFEAPDQTKMYDHFAEEGMKLLRVRWGVLLNEGKMNDVVDTLEKKMASVPLSDDMQNQLTQIFEEAREAANS